MRLAGTVRLPGLQVLHAALAAVGVMFLVLLAWVVITPDPTPGGVVELHEVKSCRVVSETLESYRRAALAAHLRRAPATADDCRWQALALPMLRPAAIAAPAFDRRSIVTESVRASYLVPNDDAIEAITIYMPRVSGGAWAVWVDGRRIADNLDNWRMAWNRPLVASVPTTLAPPGARIDIRIAIAYGRDAGLTLTPLQVGPAESLSRRIAWREALQVSMPQACSAFLLLLGSFFFAFWCGRRSERAHLLLALSSIAWCVCNLQYVVPRHDDPFTEAWYDTIVSQSTAWVMWLVYLAMLQFDPQRVRWLNWALPAYVLVVTVAAVPIWTLQHDAGLPLQILNCVVAAFVTATIVRIAWRGRFEMRLIAAALVAALAAGAHDVLLLNQQIAPNHVYLLPYSSLLVMGAFLVAMQRRYLGAIDQHEQLSNSLADRLAAREAELTATHQRLRVLEREQALSAERERLMEDIHDGLGHALVSTLAGLERNTVTPRAAVTAVRDCIVDLRDLIDSLDPIDDADAGGAASLAHDVGHLLATLRWRLHPRFHAAAITVDWALANVSPLPWLSPPLALQLLRLLQEAFTNVLKHAGADRLRVTLQDSADALMICIEDNGHGFDPGVVRPGRGTRTMRERAARLGATLALVSRKDVGTVLQLTLPRDPRQAP